MNMDDYDLFEKTMIGEIAQSVIEKQGLEVKYEKFKKGAVKYLNNKLRDSEKR